MDTKDYKTFSGAKCQALRLRAGLTQSAVAERIFSSQSYVAKIEMGIKKPSAEWLCRLSELYECRMEEFFV